MQACDATFPALPDGSGIACRTFLDLSARMASLFAARGAKKGDRIAVRVRKSAPALAICAACLRGGHVLLPLDTA